MTTAAEQHLCIIVPTYNNALTLARVLNGLLEFPYPIYVVNDGSTDDTARILDTFPSVHVITLPQNKGKGNALDTAFKATLQAGFTHAITIDSDGQHYPSDVPVFVRALQESTSEVLLVGSRNLTQEGVPKRSNFGNRFSNFWFWFETGIRLSDTQSGYRLYPLTQIPQKRYTKKFEFEIEILVRTAWKGVEVRNVPVRVLYDPNERVSHFRPYHDFARISILNCFLVFWTLIYIKPKAMWQKFKKKSWRRFLKEDVLNSSDSPKIKALSMGLGLFIGIAPLWGFQTVLALFIPTVLGWNRTLAFVFSNISIPPMIPVIIYASLEVGALFFPEAPRFIFNAESFTFDTIAQHLLQYLVGSIVLALGTSFIWASISYVVLSRYTKKKYSNV